MSSLKGKALSVRELAVIQAASEGVTYAAFARVSNCTVRTMQNRVYRAMTKLDVHSMPHAVAICMAKGWIPGPLVV